MSTYSLPPDRVHAIYKKAIVNGFCFNCVLSGIVLYLFAWQDGFQHLQTLWLTVPLVIGAMTVGTVRGARVRRDAWTSLRLDLDDQSLIKTQDHVPAVRLMRSEVTAIRESAEGIRVETAQSNQYIFVPSGIPEIDEIREKLAQWRPIVPASGLTRIFQFILIGFALTAFFGAMFSTTREIVIPTGVLSLLFLIWSATSILANAHLDSRIRKTVWWLAGPILFICMKLYLVVRS